MKNKILVGILGGIVGLVLGVLMGGFIGLFISRTFLEDLKFMVDSPILAYAATGYIGGIIGGLFLIIIGVKFAIKHFYKPE